MALGAFVVRQRRAASPLLDLELFRNPRFSAASATIMVLFFALFGFLFLATQYLQFVLGYEPLEAGGRDDRVRDAVGEAGGALRPRGVASTGMALFAAGLALAATVTTGTGDGRFGIALLLMGAGMVLAGAPATESIMSSLPPARANIGSAVNDTTRELGGALGGAVVGSRVAALRGAARRRAGGRAGVARRGGAGRRVRRAHPRRLRARDVARVDRRRGGGWARRAAGLAVPAYAGASTRWSCDSQRSVSCAASRSAAGPKQVPRMNTSVWSSQLVE